MGKVWNWLNSNSGAIQAIVVTVALIFGGITLYYNAITLREGNRIAWRTFLDSKANDLSREELDHDILHCVYHYDIKEIDSDCHTRAYDSHNLPIIMDYTQDWLEHLKEVREYSDEEDISYYDTWYRSTADSFSDDPTGVVSFVLWDYLGCNKENNSGNCDYADRLKICIKSDAFEQDFQKCFENLKFKRAKFLDRLAKEK